MQIFSRTLAASTLLTVLVAVASAQELARTTTPVLTKEVAPVYTTEAKEKRIQGVVRLDAVVLTDGTVGEVTVTKSLDQKYGLDEQAITCVKQWQFKPGTKDGKPVDVRVSIEVSFTLK